MLMLMGTIIALLITFSVFIEKRPTTKYANINIDNCTICEPIPKDEEQFSNVNFRFKCDSLNVIFEFPVNEDIKILKTWYDKLCFNRLPKTKFMIKYKLYNQYNIGIIEAVEP